MPKVLVTTPYFKPRSGGLEEYAYQVALGLKLSRGWEVVIVTSGDKDEVDFHTYGGIRTYYLPYWLRLSNTPFGFCWARALRSILQTERPDLIMAHAPVPGMIDVTAQHAVGIPFVVVYHFGSMMKGSGWQDSLIRIYEQVVLPRAFHRASAIVCSSAFVQKSTLLAPWILKTVVVNPGVDTQLFRPPTSKTSGRKIMHVGGLKKGEQHKGLDISLRVTAELKERYPDVRLVVVGNGDQENHFRSIAERLKISENVEFLGRLIGPKLATAYQAADVLITPSRKEPFGMVLIEAMACGVPVVASSTEGIPDVVADRETGLLVEPDNIDGFALGVSELFERPSLATRLSHNARSNVVDEYSWPDKVDAFAKVMESLI